MGPIATLPLENVCVGLAYANAPSLGIHRSVLTHPISEKEGKGGKFDAIPGRLAAPLQKRQSFALSADLPLCSVEQRLVLRRSNTEYVLEVAPWLLCWKSTVTDG